MRGSDLRIRARVILTHLRFAIARAVSARVRWLESENTRMVRRLRAYQTLAAQQALCIQALRGRLHQAGTRPGVRLYDALKRAFQRNGTSFSRWCREHDIRQSHARAVALGGVTGPKADAMRKQLIAAAGIASPTPKDAAP